MNWDWIIGLIGLGIGAVTIFSRMFDKSLSLREHEEFKRAINDAITLNRKQFQREVDRIEDRIKILEQTRPTTGELEARIDRNRT
jgi:hypothetical protein